MLTSSDEGKKKGNLDCMLTPPLWRQGIVYIYSDSESNVSQKQDGTTLVQEPLMFLVSYNSGIPNARVMSSLGLGAHLQLGISRSWNGARRLFPSRISDRWAPISLALLFYAHFSFALLSTVWILKLVPISVSLCLCRSGSSSRRSGRGESESFIFDILSRLYNKPILPLLFWAT
jgi:hypothetical protein